MTDSDEIEAAIEAALFATPEPIRRDKILELFGKRAREPAGEALERVIARYQPRADGGVVIEEVARGLRLVTRPELHGYLRKLFEITGQNRLSMPALETLAIVAYRQPITGPEIQEMRGVSSSGVLRTLLERRLIRIAGRKLVVGKPFLYATTREFLMHFGLKTLEDLPPLEDFEEAFGQMAAGDADVLPFEESPSDRESTDDVGAAAESVESTEPFDSTDPTDPAEETAPEDPEPEAS